MKKLKTSLRALHKFRFYTIVNILGLAISLACVIIIARYVHQETKVNNFATDLDRTYLLSIEDPENNRIRFGGFATNDISTITLPPLLRDPSIQYISTFIAFDEDYIIQNNNRINVKAIAADSLFFKILPYPLLHGSKEFTSASDVIITDKFAQKMFGKENPVGERFQYSAGDELEIIGVIGSPASKSFLDFDLLINKEQRQFMAMQPYTMAMLYPNSDAKMLNENNKELVEPLLFAPGTVSIQLFPLSEFYFDNTHEFTNLSRDTTVSVFNKGNRNSVLVLLFVGLLILLIGIFNFINIYTVISQKRGKEYGVKRLFGAQNYHIFFQIYLEVLVITVISISLAWLFIETTEPVLASYFGFIVMPNLKFSILISLILLLVLPFVAVLYPYLKFSRPELIDSLKSTSKKESLTSRKTILAIQYILSLALIVVALFFTKQLNYMLKTDPGYNTKDVIMARMMHRDMNAFRGIDMDSYFMKINENSALIKEKMNQSPLFNNWEFGMPVYNLEARTAIKRTDHQNYSQVNTLRMSPNYLELVQFDLIKGRLWNDSDTGSEPICIINESAAKLFGIVDIQNVKLEFQYERDKIDRPLYQVVGIIKDFQTGHLSKATTPVVILYTKEGFHFDYLMARFLPGNIDAAISYLQTLYKEINNGAEFNYSLLEDEIENLYQEDKRVKRVYVLFSLIAIFISCLGLFAISLFDIQQRYREIALRKINGATRKDIMNILLKKYMLLLLGSFIISLPLSHFAIYKYLENFAYKASVSWWLFAIAGIMVVGVSLLTLTWQVRKAMRINPVEALKSE